MGYIFLVIVIVLVGLAISDLVVGVSNDAVNFLNSAIGSKVAPVRIILIIAAVGILFGATFSNGMMEVARKGIFYPSEFSFSNIMLIFLAVMLTDIILLDLFNTLGLPTSTTVSIVFELLGSAVGMAFLRISQDEAQTLLDLGSYINSAKALAIISGILLSVVVAFSVGAIVQYISRLIFTFNYKKSIKYYGAIWGGLAITAITYFILIKGAKGSTLIKNPEMLKENTLKIMLLGFLFWTFLSFLLQNVFKINILKVIVLIGTFALAMAFAGNDLVNFIGVPLAGLSSYKEFITSGVSNPDTFMMESLAGKVQTPTMLLLIAGLIMVITLWFSRKSRSVVKTTLSLSNQEETDERFESSMLARSIVRGAVNAGSGLTKLFPGKMKEKIALRFDASSFVEESKKDKGLSFDLVRAAVNLIVASILIALGTSLKLPLSTTYVTFMVTMGSSLADGAWDRESAVYRITGVLTVIGGWFFTALAAFTASLIVVVFLSKSFPYGIFVLLVIVLFLVIRSHKTHKKKNESKLKETTVIRGIKIDSDSIYESFTNRVVAVLLSISELYENTMEYGINEKRRKLHKTINSIKELEMESKVFRKELPTTFQNLTNIEFIQHYVEVIDYLLMALQNLSLATKPVYAHLDNAHKSFDEYMGKTLTGTSAELKEYIILIIDNISKNDFSKSDIKTEFSDRIVDKITKYRRKQLENFKKASGSFRTNLLFLDCLNETKNMVKSLNELYFSFQKLSTQHDRLDKVDL